MINTTQKEFLDRMDNYQKISLKSYYSKIARLNSKWNRIIAIKFGKLCETMNETFIGTDTTNNIEDSLIDLAAISSYWYNEIIINSDFNLAIIKERERQDELWGMQSHTGGFWISIIGEELGEISIAYDQILNLMSKNKTINIKEYENRLATEIIQMSAVCLAWFEDIRSKLELNSDE